MRGKEEVLVCFSGVEKETEKPWQDISEVYSWLSGDPKLSHWFKATEAGHAHPKGIEVIPMNRSDLSAVAHKI